MHQKCPMGPAVSLSSTMASDDLAMQGATYLRIFWFQHRKRYDWMYSKSIPVNISNMPRGFSCCRDLFTKYYGCWWHGDVRNSDISSHFREIDLSKYSAFIAKELYLRVCFNNSNVPKYLGVLWELSSLQWQFNIGIGNSLLASRQQALT